MIGIHVETIDLGSCRLPTPLAQDMFPCCGKKMTQHASISVKQVIQAAAVEFLATRSLRHANDTSSDALRKLLEEDDSEFKLASYGALLRWVSGMVDRPIDGIGSRVCCY